MADTDQATQGMVGEGYYNRHSSMQRQGIAEQSARLERAVSLLPQLGGEIRIVDYGCGPGRNSIPLIGEILSYLEARFPASAVAAVHNDQIGNDWNDLVARLSGPDSYLQRFQQARTEISLGSFFGPVASAHSVDIGLSFGAAHWLSRYVAADAPGSLFFCDLPEPARRLVSDQAKQDWTDFLTARARELRPGGVVVLDLLSSVPDPQDPSGWRAAGRGLYRAMWRVAAEMASDGRLDLKAIDRFVFPVVFRSDKEVLAPFQKDPNVADAFEVVELSNELFPNPLVEALQQDGDRAAYAKTYASFAQAFSSATLWEHLFTAAALDTAQIEARDVEFFERLERLFEQEPERYAFDHQVTSLVLRRSDRSG